MPDSQPKKNHAVLLVFGVLAVVLWLKFGQTPPAPISNAEIEKLVAEVFRGHAADAREYAALYHGLSLLVQSEHVKTTTEANQATGVAFDMLGHQHGEIRGLSQILNDYMDPVLSKERELDRSTRAEAAKRYEELSKACLKAAGG